MDGVDHPLTGIEIEPGLQEFISLSAGVDGVAGMKALVSGVPLHVKPYRDQASLAGCHRAWGQTVCRRRRILCVVATTKMVRLL